MAGIYAICYAYPEWKAYFSYGQHIEWTWKFAGAIALFFLGTMFIISDKFYEHISVRICAFVLSAILALASAGGIIFAFLFLGYAADSDTWEHFGALPSIVIRSEEHTSELQSRL